MENKYLTLQTIYELVKDHSNPTLSIVSPLEIIARTTFPWDEIGNHLKELQSEGLLTIKQLSRAAISLTDKGIERASATGSFTAA